MNPTQVPTGRDHGVQPIDRLMTCWNLGNHRLVASSPDQLTHKQVQRARKGRQLTLHMMQKLAQSLNAAIVDTLPEDHRQSFHPYLHKHLFDYAKGHDPAWRDPNEPLMPEPS
ncbi:MAG: hypothetical protein FJ385_06365 [Verrucomicrobia bacterium]|nr:hypothetical protein [Verrucomicrobiota bacterium]